MYYSKPSKTNSSKTKAMGMFLQDPMLTDLHEDYEFPLEEDSLRGTGSSRFIIRDASDQDVPIYAGLDWHTEDDLSFSRFEKAGGGDNPQFHQVNTFAVLSNTIASVEEELGHQIVWKGRGPLVVRPHAFEGKNAYYYPEPQSLNFGYFSSPFRRTPVWTCLSADVVRHELAHAILDTMRPLYFYSGDKDTPALHESFGDLAAMFSALDNEAVVKMIYEETEGDMKHASLITRLAEEFGAGIFGAGEPYLRSALYGPAYSEASKEPHARSTTWTAAIYELLQRLVENTKPTNFNEFAAAVKDATRWTRGMIYRALHYTPTSGLSMPMLARLIYEADRHVYPNDAKFREVAKAVFQGRGLWDERINLSAPNIGADFKPIPPTDVAALSLAVWRHAEDLGIPPDVRLLDPRLVTTTRRIDKVEENGKSEVRPITEHYLEYSYEKIEIVQDMATGEPVAVALYGGGTLAMDEQWKATVLATNPERLVDDPSGAEGALRAWDRARRRFSRANREAIQANLAQRAVARSLMDPPVVAGCPVVLTQTPSGPYRLMRRVCNMRDHVNNIRFMSNMR